ncbi:SxtJ family membrane protein [Gammaproteobacteria bacterium]|nr:SxtJ family membrane protein [Gammaproteobacteria bacterium]
MKFSDIELPSNKKFGFFFTFVFAVLAFYFLFIDSILWAQGIAILAVLFLLITVIIPQVLLPLNKLWMRLGLLLGMIVSPIVLGIIFFGLVTPYGVVMRMFGRDELRLKFTKKSSHWISRSESIKPDSFENQF